MIDSTYRDDEHTIRHWSPLETFDIKSARKDLYGGKVGVFTLVDVPPQNYLMIDGHGNPNTAPEYRVAVEALYTASYAIRFAAKKQLERVHVVGPLEGLWWADDMNAFTTRSKDDWNWTMMIYQPEWITSALANAALATAALAAASQKKAAQQKSVPALAALRFETLVEGRCIQTLHVGSYDDETPVLERMHHQYMPEHGLTFAGKHHEIYLSDPRKVEPARLKTILRQPVAGS